MKILIAGCGYIGLPLGSELRATGHEVTGWVFSEKSGELVSRAGLDLIVGDLASPLNWEKYQHKFDAIIYCPSTRGGTPEDYTNIYVRGMENSLGGLKPGGRLLYTGSTSVYGQNDGSSVDESSLAEPASETGKVLLQAERTALSAGGTVLRLSAIYGPERGVLLKRFFDSSASVPGSAGRILNQIHRDDAVRAAQFIIGKEEARGEIYNVTDNEPATHGEIYEWMAHTLQKPMPVFSGEVVSRRRGESNRRISNAKLLQTGWVPRYPSFREGYVGLLKECNK